MSRTFVALQLTLIAIPNSVVPRPCPKGRGREARERLRQGSASGPRGGLVPYHGLSDSASIKAAAQARGACPGVVVNLMHRNHTLDYKWCNDLLVDMDIPFVG